MEIKKDNLARWTLSIVTLTVALFLLLYTYAAGIDLSPLYDGWGN